MSNHASTAGVRIRGLARRVELMPHDALEQLVHAEDHGKAANIICLRSRTNGRVAIPRPPTANPPATLADSLKHIASPPTRTKLGSYRHHARNASRC